MGSMFSLWYVNSSDIEKLSLESSFLAIDDIGSLAKIEMATSIF